MITYNLLNKHNEIAHFCTTREGGVSMGNYASNNLSPFSGDNTEHFAENQRKLAQLLNIDPKNIIIPYQNHGTEIREINAHYQKLSTAEKYEYLNGIDALFTQIQDICIGITTADCVPILFYDPIKKATAAVHAGWRGTCDRIAEKAVRALIEAYGCNPTDIIVTIGPSISGEVYEVGNEVIDRFEVAGFDSKQIVTIKNGLYFLDLWRANQQALENIGILNEHIEVAGICTYTENDKFFSARRLGIKSGRIFSGIMIKSKDLKV